MKQGDILTPVDDFFMSIATDILQLFYYIVQVFFITVLAGIDPDIPEKNGSALYIQNMIKRYLIIITEFSRLIQYQRRFVAYPSIGTVIAYM